MGEREICIQENVCACDADTPWWVVKIDLDVKENERLRREETGSWKKHSIYKLPEGFVRDKERRFHAYNPQVVSLGPYHHGEGQVLAMEEHKLRALRQLLVRTEKSAGDYREALKQKEVSQQLMDSYKDLDEAWRNDEEGFLKLMILDGCFMLEVMRVATTCILKDYDDNDPIFSYHGMLSNLPRIKRDMLMLENQIPLLVLHKLTAVEKGLIHEQDKQKQCDVNQKVNNDSVVYDEVNKMVLDFFQLVKTETLLSLNCRFMRRMLQCLFRWGSKRTSVPMARTEGWGLHVLDVVRKSMIEDIEGGRGRSRDVRTGSYDVIWPATQLEEAGIQFRKSDSPRLKDITFQTRFLRATLSLPQLLVDDATESKFLNLMAFEHLHTGLGKEVSSYVSFMDNIIDSDKDVSLLSRNNIIKNFVGTDQAVADLFNGISHDVSIEPASHLGEVHRKVTEYCKNRCHRYCAKLKHGYFSTPWSVIAFVAASFALVITIIQFVYALLSYYFHDN